MLIAFVIISIVLAALFLVTGGGKVIGLKYSIAGREALGISPQFWRLTGFLEIFATLGFAFGVGVHGLGIAAAIGVVALMIGAVISRLRARNHAARSGIVADVVLAALAVVIIILGFHLT